ncbi:MULTISPECIES: hypothetical protein [unclassified Terrabacter]|uniref:hypothetical protein n=1 Tax=unclassified Terrabacter TaxID=2630222 RepID=UPI0006F9FD58|nr:MULTISPECIES: hypothetical protein [unclassified Terrabacter]KRB47370.1 hypothetical protein ASD90_03140 [Terrabacter sp. Root181]KRF35724.1 hypothetical protein ASG96_20230 [Terrabacter sp. Soil810]
MSTGTLSLSPQEAIARDRIVERVASRHHAPKVGRIRRHVRAALLLRSLAERLDPSVQSPHRADLHVVPGPHAGSPRPWTAAPRRAPHRHS